MNTPALTIRHLAFTGNQVPPAKLDFESGLNLLYGASNTGKSFTLKSIDFMLGGTKSLPEFKERNGYNKVWFGFSLNGLGDFTLSRSIQGGEYELYNGLLILSPAPETSKKLAATQKSKNSLSQFLLEKLNLEGKKLARNANGETDAISFRDITAISLVDETSIQSDEYSPMESGQHVSKTKERSLFRLLLTGEDDSAVASVIDEKTFNTSKTIRIEVVEELLNGIEAKLSDYPDNADLLIQDQNLSVTLEKIQSEFGVAQGSIRKLVDEKRQLSVEIPKIELRIEEIAIHLERFAQLEDIYRSDIERLQALEEAGFLLSLGSKEACALCGAPAEAQKHTQEIKNLELAQQAALVEIAKIERQRTDLQATVADLAAEANKLKLRSPDLNQRLDDVEQEIARLLPKINAGKQNISEIIVERDHVKEGLSLFEQKNIFTAKIAEFKQLKKPSKDEKPSLKIPDSATHKLCSIISSVLKAWEFPGNCHVSFDEKTYDLKIDGKLRVNNGKGVRAVTHAAFKVALLIYCRENNLPHPGFVVLDTPLLTYRDPMKNKKAGALTLDEQELAKSSLKQRFFEHLSSIKHLGQFIVLENIDPPAGIESVAHVQTFYGDEASGRNGLFPLSR